MHTATLDVAQTAREDQVNQLDQDMMKRAAAVAVHSPISSRQVGAVIVDCQGEIISEARNGLFATIRLPAEIALNSEDSKTFWVEHAERAAIYSAAAKGIGLKGSTMYSTLFPCTSCMRAIIQCGIATLVAPLPDHSLAKWSLEFRHSKMIQENSPLIFRAFIAEEVSRTGALG